jgi:hypothetical protein
MIVGKALYPLSTVINGYDPFCIVNASPRVRGTFVDND